MAKRSKASKARASALSWADLKPAQRALPAAALEFFRTHGAQGGRKGGGLSWAALTPEQRSARARKASLAAVKARAKKARGRQA